MIKISDKKEAFDFVTSNGYDFFVGVPDSLLSGFLSNITSSGIPHMTAANEAHAIGIAFGATLAGKKPVVYMQNSGLGNAINPLTSLCIPADIKPLLIIGHRHTLPQHRVMGEVDVELLKLIGYDNFILVEGNNNDK